MGDDQILAAAKLALGFGIYEQDPEKLAGALAEHIVEIDRAARRLSQAAKLLHELCGVRDLSHLPYKYQLVLTTLVFASGLSKVEPSAVKKSGIAKWFWRSSFLELFAGISEGRLNQVTKELRTLLDVGVRYEWPSWLSGEVEGPPSPRKDSARLRTLRTLFSLRGESVDEELEEFRAHPGQTPTALVEAERLKVEEVGLKYTHVTRESRAPARTASASGSGARTASASGSGARTGLRPRVRVTR